MSKKAVKSKKAAQSPYPTKTIAIGFVILLGFSACESMKNQSETTPEPETTQTAPVLTPTSYPVPPADAKTKKGELQKEAEQRYLQYAHEKTETGETDEDLLKAGYTLCGFFKESADRPELFVKIDEVSADDPARRIHLTNLSTYASQTICPEYSTF